MFLVDPVGGINLGKVAGELLVPDPLILHRIEPVTMLIEAAFSWVLAVVIAVIARSRGPGRLLPGSAVRSGRQGGDQVMCNLGAGGSP